MFGLKKKKELSIDYYEKIGKFDSLQLSQIHMGLMKGLDVSIYAKPEISSEVMYTCRLFLEEGMSAEEIKEHLGGEIC